MKTLHQIIIIASLFYPVYILADNLEQMNQERQNNRQTFLNSLNQIQSCSESVKNLSNRALALEKHISEKRDFYKNIQTEEDFQTALNDRKKMNKNIWEIKTRAQELEQSCPFASFDSVLSQLDSAIEALKGNVWSMDYDQDWIKTNKEINQKIHTKHKLMRCISDLNNPSVKIISWSFYINLANEVGDMFMINKGISNLKVLNDYITNVLSVCDVENTMQVLKEKNISSTIKNIDQEIITDMQEDLQNSKKALITAEEQFSLLNFEESSAKMCKTLEEQDKDQVGICEAPLDNPSWHYSAHYFLNKES